ncbi:uncharacterized protein [Rutidosis leptorrhynchoides]|uniref:uncharacterized protein n=1 Tax=Rutidosis leptorrhynchoides TaxID=125765 RepID=UPI003A99ECED
MLDAPTPSPSPSPKLDDYAGPITSPSPASSPPQHSSHLSPKNDHKKSLPPLPNAPPPSCDGFRILPGPPPTYLPRPRPRHHSNSPPPMYQKLEMPPDLPPLPIVSYGSLPDREKEDQKLSEPSVVFVSSYVSSSATGSFSQIRWPLFLFTLMVMALQTL